MKNWNLKTEEKIETPKNIKLFLKEIFELYEKYNLSISHQDGQGAFIIEENNEINQDWLKEAHLNINNENKSLLSPLYPTDLF